MKNNNNLTSLLKEYEVTNRNSLCLYEDAQNRFLQLVKKGLTQKRGNQLIKQNSKPTRIKVNDCTEVAFIK